jgi:hypothetical protein
MLILEEKVSYIDHDRLFKELIKTFFEEFVEAFFPEEYAYINFSSVQFLEQEVFTDLVKGERREIDILAEVSLKGENQIILIHVEPQSTLQKEFHERMFIYCSRLYEKFRKPILPIGVFSYNDRRDVPSEFQINLPTISVLQFRYLHLHLIKKDWRSFIRSDNPAAAALLSKMGYTEEERVQVRLEFLKMVSRMELDPAEMALLYGFFDTYLKLNDEEEKQMREEASHLPEEEANRVLALPNYYFDKGIEQGKFQEKVETIKRLYKLSMTIEQIAEAVCLDREKVEEIIKEANQ